MDKVFTWSSEKNALLKQGRGFGFEDVVEVLQTKGVLDNISHPGTRYSHQRIYVIDLDGYVVAVPYVETDEEIFLKTAFPDRKLNRRYLKK